MITSVIVFLYERWFMTHGQIKSKKILSIEPFSLCLLFKNVFDENLSQKYDNYFVLLIFILTPPPFA